jgi:hypothetical protein
MGLSVFFYIISMPVPCLNTFQPAKETGSVKEITLGPCTYFPGFCFMHHFIFRDCCSSVISAVLCGFLS